jgi:hypothetical protein
MTPYQKRTLSPLAQRMAGDMCVRNLSQRTIDAYTVSVKSDRHGDSVGIMVASSFGGRGCLGRGSGGRYQMGSLGSWRRRVRRVRGREIGAAKRARVRGEGGERGLGRR